MPTYLLTIREVRRVNAGIQLLPGIRIGEASEHVKSMKQGSRLEMRLPDGRVVQNMLLSYGVPVERNAAGGFIYRGNPDDAEIVLLLPAETRDDDVVTGTEVWLV